MPFIIQVALILLSKLISCYNYKALNEKNNNKTDLIKFYFIFN